MTNAPAKTPTIVRDPKSGRFVAVYGAGALKGSTPSIKRGVDLTKPIASQTLNSNKHK